MAQPAFQSLRRLTVDEALRMVDAGILGEDEPVELLDGWLVELCPQGPLHAASTTNLADRLRGAYGETVYIREEKPLACGPNSLPEPDVAVVGRADGGYARRHPTGTDAILVVELAWSSQDEDRKKATIYARNGVSTYWLVDLAARKLEIYTMPGDEGYGDVATLGDGATVALPGLATVWSVRDVLGPAARSGV